MIVEAESGEMGGSGSHQFTVPCETGEDVIGFVKHAIGNKGIRKLVFDKIVDSINFEINENMSDLNSPPVS